MLRIICPDTELTKRERVNSIFDQINEWIHSEPFMELVNLFGGDHLPDNLYDRLSELNRFVEVWNYRNKQKTGETNERFNVSSDDFLLANQDLIINNCTELGLVEKIHPCLNSYDYVLVLGGARAANYNRTELAKEVIDDLDNLPRLFALTGKRPLNLDKEYDSIKAYADQARTEYDVVNRCFEEVFSFTQYDEQVKEDPNINKEQAVRIYTRDNNEFEGITLCAPSSDPDKRRANSMDTFLFFLDKFHIEKKSKIILCTSQIYSVYQLMVFMKLAIDYDFYIDCVGTPGVKAGSVLNPASYLQEIKGSINAMFSFMEKFKEYL